jgi:hypothetical protein
MINAEILSQFTHAGSTYTQVGVHHLPRRGGRATGAKPSVILRAFRELFMYGLKWRREEKLFEKKAEREKSRMPHAKQSVEQAVAYKEPEKPPKA